MRARHPIALALTALVALGVAACDPPEADAGGSSPEPSGVLRGSVLYIGPRPACDYDGASPTRVRGNAVLLLFLADNPPPPAGGATSAENLLVIPGRYLFALADCLPAAPTPADLRVPVTRTVDLTWPEVALAMGHDVTVDYEIRGFYDSDEDFDPFFSVRRLATKGDVAGGAFVNAAASPAQFARIEFESAEDRPNGQAVDGVAVTLAAFVNTELPTFELADASHGLSSEATVPPLPDPIAREQALFDLSHLTLSLLDPSDASTAATLAAAGMSLDPHPSGYGFFTLPVDADRDGVQDPHPILGSSGVMWEHPIVILRRARTPIESAMGIPDVTIIASVRPTRTFFKDTFAPELEVIVPPIAVVDLDPSNPSCRVPYVAPANLAETYEGPLPTDCQELPTGNYDVNVLAGIAGGRAIDYRAQLAAEMPGLSPAELEMLVRARTDTDWVIEGGQYSSQAWSIPNELGCPDPTYRPNALDPDGRPIAVSQIDANPLATCGDPRALPSDCDEMGSPMRCDQGPAGRFSVVDPDPSNPPDATDRTAGHGVATCQTTIRGATMMPDAVRYLPVPAACCAAVAHLCGVPLCSLRNDAVRPGAGGSRAIREVARAGEDYDVAEDGTITPRCVPFLPPSSCCE